MEQPKHLFVDAMVASRTGLPAVSISSEHGMIAQMDIADARQFAGDIVQATHNAEADAMVVRFFRKLELPPEALAAFLMEFRDFRASLESDANRARMRRPSGDGDQETA